MVQFYVKSRNKDFSTDKKDKKLPTFWHSSREWEWAAIMFLWCCILFDVTLCLWNGAHLWPHLSVGEVLNMAEHGILTPFHRHDLRSPCWALLLEVTLLTSKHGIWVYHRISKRRSKLAVKLSEWNPLRLAFLAWWKKLWVSMRYLILYSLHIRFINDLISHIQRRSGSTLLKALVSEWSSLHLVATLWDACDPGKEIFLNNTLDRWNICEKVWAWW